MSDTIHGTIKHLSDKGFGFIIRHDCRDELFFHARDCMTQFEELNRGELVTFTVETDQRRGKEKAIGVCRVPVGVT